MLSVSASKDRRQLHPTGRITLGLAIAALLPALVAGVIALQFSGGRPNFFLAFGWVVGTAELLSIVGGVGRHCVDWCK